MRDLTGRTDQAEIARRRQNMTVAAMAITAIVAIVTVVVGPWRGGREMSDIEGQAGSESVAAPPGVDGRGPHLIVSPASLPVAGGEVALILANPGDTQVSWSVTGMLERWSGSGWANHRQVTAGLNAEGPTGKLVSLEEDLVVPMIYIGVEPGRFSQPHWTRIEGIDPGWYRFTFGPASGLFQVGPASFAAARPVTAFAFDGEGVVRSGSEATLHLRVMPRKRLAGSFDPAEQVGDYTSAALVERLDTAQGPEEVSTVSTVSTRTEGADEPLSFALHLPALEPGVYRVSRETSVAGRVESLLWAAPLQTGS